MITKSSFIRVVVGLCLNAVPFVQAQTVRPQIGYVYPAGGQRGTEFDIVIGGQVLRQATDIVVAGEGVEAEVVRYVRPLRNLNGDQRKLLTNRLKEVRERRLDELRNPKSTNKRKNNQNTRTNKKKDQKQAKDEPDVKLPDHPLLDDLDNKSLRELAHIRDILFFPRNKLQLNRQIAEMLVVRVRISPDAKPGKRELRVNTKGGMTNPVVFEVGLLHEVKELEPNNQEAYPLPRNLPKDIIYPREKALRLPVTLNGQIMPGDRDRFLIHAKKGEKLVLQVHARSLIPYLADAVPGWFQATVALYDADGAEVAFQDDFRFHPDPVLFYEIKKEGDYELEIRDSIYRGREDFVYRILVGELPFITQVFPLGGRMGVKTVASIDGWNLPEPKLALDMTRGEDGIRQTAYDRGNVLSNNISYAVDVLPEVADAENNNRIEDAQAIVLPKIVNGRIDQPGDMDVFAVQGRAGQKLVAEVYARRLNTPLDSFVRITDAEGKTLAYNDDYVVKENHLFKNMMGLMTHHADSYVMTELPTDGTYYVHLTDAQRHGGREYAYRLRLSKPRGDFGLRVTPSSYGVRPGGIIPLTVHAIRKDGFDGEIRVTIAKAPEGFEIKGGRIPPGRDRVRLTLTAPQQGFEHPVPIVLQGIGRDGTRTIRRRVVPAEDTMQAFLYRHLVPAEQLLVSVQKGRGRAPSIELAGHNTVQIPVGGSADVKIKVRMGQSTLQEIKLALLDPPEGIRLGEMKVVDGGVSVQVYAKGDTLTTGYEDNLIIEASREYFPKTKNGTKAKKKSRYVVGVLPAVPFKIIH